MAVVQAQVTRALVNSVIKEYIAKGERPTAKLISTHFATPTSPKISVYLSDYIEENPWEWHKAQLPPTVVAYVEGLHSRIDEINKVIKEYNVNFADEVI